MNETFLNKLNEILDDSINEHTKKTDAQVKSFFDAYGVPYDECYAYFLKYHGNDYIKDDYWFLLKNDAGDTEQYMVDMLFGLQECTGNIINEMKEWEDVVQDDLVCIADRPGGDLVCMDKEDGSIWFWFHDVADDNLVMVADSFEEFICGFSYEEPASSNNDEPEISLSPEMDKLLRKKAQEYNK